MDSSSSSSAATSDSNVWNLTSSLKKKLVWETTYKGHRIRLDNGGMWAEKIDLDDGLVQTGGFGTKMEFRTRIKAGDGIGDEIIVCLTQSSNHAVAASMLKNESDHDFAFRVMTTD